MASSHKPMLQSTPEVPHYLRLESTFPLSWGVLGTFTTNSIVSLALFPNALRMVSTACWWETPWRDCPSTDTSSNPAYRNRGGGGAECAKHLYCQLANYVHTPTPQPAAALAIFPTGLMRGV
ncbi:hypothetical protein JZ751_007987 [Albula glossodonta]|uniref:Uncharacterized protein n=1 Tax=Albula glossodonta TaxID=121402 RepID=A0A8T2P1H1_9TELE|nr:hypothetical protein JZ751_007987 [Albula glossodonta]